MDSVPSFTQGCYSPINIGRESKKGGDEHAEFTDALSQK